jgi:site-specific DNA recombinase
MTQRELRAAVYARFSTKRQDARSIDDQVRECRRFAETRGCQLVAVFEDSGTSGATLERSGLQQLLAEAATPACRFGRVIVHDLSRLSRDLGDTWRLVFDDLEGQDVVVDDVTTGISSDNSAARTTFGALALVNDMTRQSVRQQTHRGLKGRALADFHTGGRCYGFTTVREENPADPAHPRALVVVDQTESAIVKRIFRAYADGAAPRVIAALLNAENVPAPYDRTGYAKQAGQGWSHTTVRAILRNERYIGTFVWNRRVWKRAGAKKRRVPRLRPESEWIRRDRPELAIVDKPLWNAVQSRSAERSRQANVPKQRRSGPTSALSGLLRCGMCGNRMSIFGSKEKAGVVYRNFACSANRSKGVEVCPSCNQYSELKLLIAMTETVRVSLGHRDLTKRFLESFEKHWARQEARHATSTASDAVRSEIRSVEAKRDRLVRAVEDGGDAFGAVVDRLRALEQQLRDLRQRLSATLDAEREQGNVLDQVEKPTPAQLLAALGELDAVFRAAPAEANAALSARITDVVVAPRPTKDAGFSLEFALKTTTAALGRAAVVGSEVSGTDGCGGRI